MRKQTPDALIFTLLQSVLSHRDDSSNSGAFKGMKGDLMKSDPDGFSGTEGEYGTQDDEGPDQLATNEKENKDSRENTTAVFKQ